MPGITISAAYGAGGQFIAHAVAERLGLPVLDRAINTAIAQRLHVSEDEAQGAELKRSVGERFFTALARMTPEMLGVIAPDGELSPQDQLLLDDSSAFRTQAETIMREAMATGAVVHGRAGACVFLDDPSVLRVRIYGEAAACRAQAEVLHHVSPEQAVLAQRDVDQARAHYMRRLYGRDIDDRSLYHLLVDGARVGPDRCVEIVLAAWHQVAGAGAGGAVGDPVR